MKLYTSTSVSLHCYRVIFAVFRNIIIEIHLETQQAVKLSETVFFYQPCVII